MTKNFFDFLREDSPYSTMRVAVILLIVLFFPPFVVVWTYLSFTGEELKEIPDSVRWLLAILLLGKSGQKLLEIAGQVFGAKKEAKKPEEPQSPEQPATQ